MVAHTARLNLTVQRSASPASSGGLNGLVERFPEGAGALPYRFATRVRRYVRAKAPVRTGYLKSSVNRTLVGPRAHRVTVGAHYDHIDDLTASDLAWEWLRRNDAYDHDYEAFDDAHVDRQELTGKIRQQWGLRFPCRSSARPTKRPRLLATAA